MTHAPDPTPTPSEPPRRIDDPPPRPGRAVPVGVGVVAVLGLLFGALGVVWKPLALVSVLSAPVATTPATGGGDGAGAPVTATVAADAPEAGPSPGDRATFVGLSAAGVVASGLLVASSLGAMGVRPWARWGMLGYALLAAGLVVTQFALVASAGPVSAGPAGEGSPGVGSAAVRAGAMLVYPIAVAAVFGRRGWRVVTPEPAE